LDFYNLGRDQLAEKVSLSGNKTTALIWHTNLKADPECCKEFLIGKSKFTRYSQKAITRIKEELKKISIDAIWENYCKRDKAACKK
jgi:L-rhamnose isomerase